MVSQSPVLESFLIGGSEVKLRRFSVCSISKQGTCKAAAAGSEQEALANSLRALKVADGALVYPVQLLSFVLPTVILRSAQGLFRHPKPSRLVFGQGLNSSRNARHEVFYA